jgi:mannosyltransferase
VPLWRWHAEPHRINETCLVSTTSSASLSKNVAPGRTHLTKSEALPRRELIAVIVVTALALVLCLIDLGSRSLWLDEFYSAFVARSPGQSVWHAITADGGNFMGYYALLHAWVLAFGWTPFVLRLPSALAGAALVPVVFSLGRRAGGSTVGLVACLLVAVSPPLVVWAQQARGYSIGVLGVSLTWLMLVRLQDAPTRTRYVIFCAAAIVTTYFLVMASLVIAAGLVWFYLASPQGKAKAKVIISAVVYVLGCLPLVIIVQVQGVSERARALGAPGVAAPSWSSARSLMSELSSESVPDFFPPRFENAVLTGIVLLCWGTALVLLVRRRRGTSVGERLIAKVPVGFVFWLVVPVILNWIISVTSGESIFGTSFLLPVVPGGLLLAGYGLASLRWRVGLLTGTLALAGLA